MRTRRADAQRSRGARRRPDPRPRRPMPARRGRRPVRRPPRRQRPQRRGRGRPAGHPVRLLARLGTGPLAANLRRHAELSGVDPRRLRPGRGAGQPRRRRAGARRLGRLRLPRPRAPPTGSGPTRSSRTSSRSGPRSCTSARSPAGRRRAARRSRGWSSGSPARSALISVDPNIRPMLADGPVGRLPRQHRGDRPRPARPAASADADIVKVSAEDLAGSSPRPRPPTPSTRRPPVGGARARAGAGHRRRLARCGSPGRAAVLHRRTPEVDRRRHRRRGRFAGRRAC